MSGLLVTSSGACVFAVLLVGVLFVSYFYQSDTDGEEEIDHETVTDYSIWWPLSTGHIMKMIPTMALLFSLQPMFPTLAKSMKRTGDTNVMKRTITGLILVASLFLLLSLICLLLFGKDIQGDILLNFGESKNEFKFILLSLYLCLAAMHIPVIFFVGKESLLEMYAELAKGAVSSEMDSLIR